MILIARYGEVHLKGANRAMFLRALTKNLVDAVGKQCRVTLDNGRYIFSDFKPEEACELCTRISKVFGLTSVSPCHVVGHDKILEHLKSIAVDFTGTFKCNVNRADKSFPHTSMEFAAIAGSVILDANSNVHVDVHNPQKIINIDIRENNNAFIYDEIVSAVGGMPVGTAGRALVFLSGGIDSPVAAYLAAKRGLAVEYIHFESPPYTSSLALDKVRRLATVLEDYCGKAPVHVVPFTEIQKQIKARCDQKYTITIMRRFMVRIAEQFALEHKINCLITGENLSQVASQTVAGITTNNICAKILPIFRPLITYDKSEIITLAKRIGTYDISIEPHQDCCTVFVPDSPVINPTVQRVIREESNLPEIGKLVQTLDEWIL